MPKPNDAEYARPMRLIGLMSGTSVDAVDACAVQLAQGADGRLLWEILGTTSRPWPDNLREQLLALPQTPVSVATLSQCHRDVARVFADTTHQLLAETGLRASDIDALGSHGQTVWHQPPLGGEPGHTLQLGSVSMLAEWTGIRTVGDFRPRDMAAGGQGAPLVSRVDQWLFGRPDGVVAVQNLGGIANVTALPPADSGNDPIAFDTGPANMLIDLACQQAYGEPFDRNGRHAVTGKVDPVILATLMSHPYLAQSPPKTTGREQFGAPMLQAIQADFPDRSPEDWVATLTQFTVESIAAAYRRWVCPLGPLRAVIVGGGGVQNPTLMGRLTEAWQAMAPGVSVTGHEAYGIPSQYKEALAFAVLAWAALTGQTNTAPSCTGARHAVVAGVIAPS